MSVKISPSGNTLIVSYPKDADSKGSAIIYERDDTGFWSEKSKLIASDGIEDSYLGTRVGVSVSDVIVGTGYLVGIEPQCKGSAYLF